MLRFGNSFNASQVLFLVLPLFVLVRIVPRLPLSRAEYHVKRGTGDVNAGRDHEDEPPFGMSWLKEGTANKQTIDDVSLTINLLSHLPVQRLCIRP